MSVLTGMAIMAGAAVALMPQLMPHPSGEGVHEESALSVVAASPDLDKTPDKAADKGAGFDDGRSGAVANARSAAVADRAAVAHAQISCDDLSASFLAPQCQAGKAGRAAKSRRSRSARAAASQRVAAPDALVQAEQPRAEQQRAGHQKAAASRPAPTAATVPAAVAANDAPTEPPLPKPAKKPVKTAHKKAPSRDSVGADTWAAARPPAFNLFGPFHEPPRTGTGVWAMSR